MWENNLADPLTVGIHKTIARNFSVYPNPATEKVWVEFTPPEPGLYIATIINASGQVVGRKELRSTGMMIRTQLDVSKLSSGYYLIRIAGNETVHNRMVLVGTHP